MPAEAGGCSQGPVATAWMPAFHPAAFLRAPGEPSQASAALWEGRTGERPTRGFCLRCGKSTAAHGLPGQQTRWMRVNQNRPEAGLQPSVSALPEVNAAAGADPARDGL